MSEPTPKRRWFRFSLRMLFVVVTLLGIYMGYLADRVWRERTAVQAVLDTPGSIRFDYQRKGYRHPPGKRWLQQLVGKEWYQEVVEITVRSTGADDRLLEKISDLRSLESLDLGGTKITDAGLRSISKLKKLQKLDLSFTQVGDQGLAHLANLPELVHLDLDSTLVTDEGLCALEPLKNLSSLTLCNTRISDRGLEALVRMVGLSELDLPNTQVTYRGLRSLVTMKSLTWLRLSTTHGSEIGFTAAGLAELRAALPSVTVSPLPASVSWPTGTGRPPAPTYPKRNY